MEIRAIQGISRYELLHEISRYIELKTRFTCQPEINEDRGRFIKIRMIRLKSKKAYCGNHPNACEVAGSHRKGNWLEGLDWVEFNDHINDILDLLNVSANVRTSVCILRKGRLRRIHYGSHLLDNRFWVWNMDEPESEWEDHCGSENPPISSYPIGTPGEYHRNLDEPIKVVG